MIHKNLMKSTIKTPSKRFTSWIDQNEHHDKLLVFGYINKLWKLPKYANIQTLPYYLINLIAKWVCFEDIHLMAVDSQHWKINIAASIKYSFIILNII